MKESNRSIFILKLMISVVLCISCETSNSNSSDELFYGGVAIQDSSLVKPYVILKNNCMSCHTSSIHSKWLNYVSNNDWVNNGEVVAGEPENSKLLHRMINTPASEANGEVRNMPQGGSAISDEDYQTLRSWIENL